MQLNEDLYRLFVNRPPGSDHIHHDRTALRP